MRFISGLQPGSKVEGVLAFGTVLNEIQRLPYFLQYHRDLGVSHFFLVDNGSEDGSLSYLEAQDDVTLYATNESYNLEMRGVTWLDDLKFDYALNQWCLTLDIDELFVYPNSETIPIDSLCNYLDSEGYIGVFSLMIDFYDDKRLCDYKYQPSKPFWEFSPFFDSSGYFVRPVKQFPYFGLYGGPRYRTFYRQQTSAQGPTMRKIPLVKWNDGVDYLLSTHATPFLNLADVTSAILHFRFLVDFEELMQAETTKHYVGLSDHARYLAELGATPERNLHCDKSVKYGGSEQLISLALIKTSSPWLAWQKAHEPQHMSQQRISISPKENPRMTLRSFACLWPSLAEQQLQLSPSKLSVAVVIRVLDNPRYLNRAVKSALNQPEVIQIILVHNEVSERVRAILGQVTKRYAKVKSVDVGSGCKELSIQHCLIQTRDLIDADLVTVHDSIDKITEARFQRDIFALESDTQLEGVFGRHTLQYESADAIRSKVQKAVDFLDVLSKRFSRGGVRNIVKIHKGVPHPSTLTFRSALLNRSWFDSGTTDDSVFSFLMLLKGNFKDCTEQVPCSSLLVSQENQRISEINFDPDLKCLLGLFFNITELRGGYLEASYVLQSVYVKLNSSDFSYEQRRETIRTISLMLNTNAQSFLFLMLDSCQIAPTMKKHVKQTWREIGIEISKIVRPTSRWPYITDSNYRVPLLTRAKQMLVEKAKEFLFRH